jgi:hypothetical protein
MSFYNPPSSPFGFALKAWLAFLVGELPQKSVAQTGKEATDE